MNDTPARIHIESSIRSIPAADWNACARSGISHPETGTAEREPNETGAKADEGKFQQLDPASQEDDRNPFVSHEFLSSLEASGAVNARTGWHPQHMVVERKGGGIDAVMPCYLKSHSQGEYVFDHGWAEAYERAGGDYYPKLQVSVPFTPVTGPRLLVRSNRPAQAREVLLAGAIELCERHKASSLHITFPTRSEWKYLIGLGLLARTDRQFHWVNEGYHSFNDFLGALVSRKRKVLARERRDATDGIEVVRLTGRELTENVWDAFFKFYMDTGSRKWGRPYLNRKFFSLVGEAMGDRILLIMARSSGRWIAGALNFVGSNTIYGRYWGAIEHRPFLHFELCYYQAIDYAIENGLARVEAGAQGAHKLARGYRPVPTYSAHYIADPGLAHAIADYLMRERAYVRAEGRELAAMAPFREDGA